MTITLATIPCAHAGCDRPAVWHFFTTGTGELAGSSCDTDTHYEEFDEGAPPCVDYRAVHTKDAFEIVNRMNQEA